MDHVAALAEALEITQPVIARVVIEVRCSQDARLAHEPPGRRTMEPDFRRSWLGENGFDEIDKGVRSRLQNCIDHLPEIEAWRQNIGLTQRLKLNHPNTVWRGWQATQTASNKGDGKHQPAAEPQGYGNRAAARRAGRRKPQAAQPRRPQRRP